MANLVPLSRFLALMLRHKPHNFGLVLDAEGFTDLNAIWLQIEKRFDNRYTQQDLEQVVAGDKQGKKRYEIRGNSIRAMYGHSTQQAPSIIYEAIEPPEILYHGTDANVVESIMKTGLSAQQRQYVHLTPNLNIATTVAQRHAKETTILRIHAQKAYQAGIIFHQAEAENYLTKSIPPEYLEVLE